MKKKRAVKDVHKQSLADQLDDPETHGVRTKPHKKARRGAGKQADDDASIGAEQSAAILDLARAQQEDEAQLRVQETAGADTRAAPHTSPCAWSPPPTDPRPGALVNPCTTLELELAPVAPTLT